MSCPRCGTVRGHTDDCPSRFNPLLALRVNPFGPESESDVQCPECHGYEGHWGNCHYGFEELHVRAALAHAARSMRTFATSMQEFGDKMREATKGLPLP
jgi:hypothetical protein